MVVLGRTALNARRVRRLARSPIAWTLTWKPASYHCHQINLKGMSAVARKAEMETGDDR